jgi:hypothetical protein
MLLLSTGKCQADTLDWMSQDLAREGLASLASPPAGCSDGMFPLGPAFGSDRALLFRPFCVKSRKLFRLMSIALDFH